MSGIAIQPQSRFGPWWRMPAWMTAGMAQRNPNTGKAKRNPSTGKLRRNTDAITECGCGDECPYEKFAITSITRSGGTAIVTTAAPHGLPNLVRVTIGGADQAQYNGTFQISNVTTSGFWYTVTGSPATPATTSTALTWRPADCSACTCPIDTVSVVVQNVTSYPNGTCINCIAEATGCGTALSFKYLGSYSGGTYCCKRFATFVLTSCNYSFQITPYSDFKVQAYTGTNCTGTMLAETNTLSVGAGFAPSPSPSTGVGVGVTFSAPCQQLTSPSSLNSLFGGSISTNKCAELPYTGIANLFTSQNGGQTECNNQCGYGGTADIDKCCEVGI